MPVSLVLLRQIPLLQRLPPNLLEDLSLRMQLAEFSRREMVMSREMAKPVLGFLLSGRLQGVDFTVDGRSVGLYFVEPGDFFGELPLVDGQPASEHILAAVKSTTAFLDATVARELITTHPSMAQAVMRRLASRVRAASAQRTLLSLPNPFQRLCALLLQLPQRPASGGAEVDQAPTHQELAIMINASRETVTRAFQVLFLRGIVQREGQALRLVNTQVLQAIAQGTEEPPRG